MSDIGKILCTLGRGFKVAIEGIPIAADKGLLERYSDVLEVGGTGRGADTAIIAGGTRTEDNSSQDSSKKLEIGGNASYALLRVTV